MSKLTTAIATLGVVAGLGVAALPLSSYAADTADTTLKVHVSDTISIENVVPTDTIEGVTNQTTAGTVDFGNIFGNADPVYQAAGIKVTSSDTRGYKINIQSKTADTTALQTADKVNSIPAGVVGKGTSAWSFKAGTTVPAGVSADITTDTAVEGTPQTIFTRATGATTETTGDVMTIIYGVSASATQAAGDYTGVVTLTAVTNA